MFWRNGWFPVWTKSSSETSASRKEWGNGAALIARKFNDAVTPSTNGASREKWNYSFIFEFLFQATHQCGTQNKDKKIKRNIVDSSYFRHTQLNVKNQSNLVDNFLNNNTHWPLISRNLWDWGSLIETTNDRLRRNVDVTFSIMIANRRITEVFDIYHLANNCVQCLSRHSANEARNRTSEDYVT